MTKHNSGSWYVVKMMLAAGLLWGSSLVPALADDNQTRDWADAIKNIPLGPGDLSFDLNLRGRYEYQDNFNVRKYGTDKSDDLLLWRGQMGLGYQLDLPDELGDPQLYVQFQDARHWLNDLSRHDFPQSCPFYDQFDLRQAYVEWRKIAATPLGFKAGRQNISYADNRVFGPGEWGNAGRYWWDAVKFFVETEPVTFDLLYGQRVISEPVQANRHHFDFEMWGVYAHVKQLPFDLDLFYLLRHDDSGQVKGKTGQGDERRHSVGLYIDGKIDAIDYRGTLAGQFGNYGKDDILAYGGNLCAGYTFNLPWKPRLGGEFSYASGDRNPNGSQNGTFDGIFGAIDTIYGRMNFLSWKNMEDYQLSASVQPLKKLKLSLDYHCFRLASADDAWYWSNGNPMRSDKVGRSGQDLGGEIDLIATWNVHKHLGLMAGYGHFFPGSFIQRTGTADSANWFFLQTTLKF